MNQTEIIKLYEKANKRLRRIGVKTPTEQIAYLEGEIELYRERIRAIESPYLTSADRATAIKNRPNCKTCSYAYKGEKGLFCCYFNSLTYGENDWCYHYKEREND